MIDLSIIIVSYNTANLLKTCIDSLTKNVDDVSYEIIVVDNASKDKSPVLVKKLSKKFPIRLVENKENLGFAKANNVGIKEARGKYVLLLNSDTEIKENIFSDLLSFMERNPNVGALTCALKGKDGELQGAGGYFPYLFRIFAWMFFIDDIPLLDIIIKPFHPVHANSFFYKGKFFLSKKQEKDWIAGTFFLTRKKVFNKAGGFDEDYFMYTEDVDLCWKIKKAGWKIFYLPSLSITHLGGASSIYEFPILSEYKGIKLFYKKHMPAWQYPVLRFFLKTGAILRMLIFGLIKDAGGKVYAKAYKIA